MSSTSVAPSPLAPTRTVLIDPQAKQKPRNVDLMCDWQYLERSIHRLLAAWGREVAEWNDKSTIHRQIWDQAECVRRLRERVSQFPGGKPDAPVSGELERLVNTVLLAPSLDDALDGIYVFLLKNLVTAYGEYSARVHPIHDAPTIALLHEINQIKSQQWLWYRDYRRRHPHTLTPDYRARIEAGLTRCQYFKTALPVHAADIAQPAGVNTDFRLARFSARVEPTKCKQPFMDYVRADFATSIEARRLFWAYGYMLEKNIPDDQLAWLYWGHYMPWDWHHDISRHLWDESRHGDSGYSRLCDFGITLEEVGFASYEQAEREKTLGEIATQKGITRAEAEAQQLELLRPFRAEPITKELLYQHVFMIGMVAETGHFVVKNEGYVDFKEGQDLDSAEMMLFDIIDETAHVQYAHRWLPLLAEEAGIDNSDYRERAAKVREEYQANAIKSADELRQKLSRTPGDPCFDFYQDLLARIRATTPLTNAQTCPPRSPKPM
ncbi:MAG: hypothetical protein K9M98_13410 [Cephaloticoccus sp.]|nr:hypothetical protein [Cephaloticoccus sp.]MCF7761490.1 hypothetical protein [Cephaloticoccus sp.]